MRTFPTLFSREKNRKRGSSPFWILECPFPSTGTIYLSEHAVTFSTWKSGAVTRSWVVSWGQIAEDINDNRALTNVSKFSFDLIIDPNSAPDIREILETEANNAEVTDCSLYLAFRDLIGSAEATDPPELMWKGTFTDWEKTSDLILHVEMVDRSVRLDTYIGTKLSLADYPDAHLDDVGKMMNIVYGANNMVTGLRAAWGGVTTLKADITASDTASLELSDASQFPSSGSVWIGNERIAYSSKSGNTLSTLSRAQGGTTASGHSTGADVHEYLAQYDSIIAGHELKTVTNMYAEIEDKLLRVTSGVSAVVVSGRHILRATSHITLSGGVPSVTDPGHSHSTSETIARTGNSSGHNGANFTWTGADLNLRDGSLTTYLRGYFYGDTSQSATMTVGFPTYTGPTPSAVYAVITHESFIGSNRPAGAAVICGTTGLDISSTKVTQRIYLGTTVPSSISVGLSHPYHSTSYGISSNVYEISMEVVVGSTSVNSTNVTIADGSVATRFVQRFHALVDGHKDDGSGTITGTPDALIERPDHVAKHFLNAYASWALADFYSDAGTPFGSTYLFSIVLTEYRKLKEWLAKMAWESRCYFRIAAARAELLYRPDSLTSDKTITSAMIGLKGTATSISLERSALAEIINTITLHYDRDATKEGDEAYRATLTDSNAGSITRYGEKEQPDLFRFDFVRSSTMATALVAFYLARYKDRKKVITMELFLDNAELEFADAVTIAPLSNLLCEVQKVNVHPGSAVNKRNDKITLIAKEY